jgi:hypothetical protein
MTSSHTASSLQLPAVTRGNYCNNLLADTWPTGIITLFPLRVCFYNSTPAARPSPSNGCALRYGSASSRCGCASWLTPSEVKAALDYVEELRLLAKTVTLPPGLPGHVAGACFAIVQEHHHGIIRLLEMGLNSPAFVLLRPTFETYVRGEWLGRRTERRVQEVPGKGRISDA